MNKLKVFGLGNEKDYTFVIFSKDQDFFKSFGDLTKKAFGHVCYSHEIEKTAEAGRHMVKRVSDYADRHETCTDHGVVFDLFFGAKKVFVVIHAPAKARDMFMSALGKSVKWAR
jgi:hypothetical protein